MTFQELRAAARHFPIFTTLDVLKWYPKTEKPTLRHQLSFWAKKGYLERIARDLYKLSDYDLEDEFFLSSKIYSPSYISLETALNSYGIIPDIPFSVTAVTFKKTKESKTPFGLFSYRSLKKELFFGFKIVSSRDKKLNYAIATPKKAVFDFLYLHKREINLKVFPYEERFNFEENFPWQDFIKISKIVKDKKFLQICQKLQKNYAS